MHRPLSIVTVLILVAACASDGSGDTTTSSTVSSTSSTTSTTAVTTTTMATTTTAPTTTTTGLLEGNWAEAPLVVSNFGALGWWDGANWVQVDETTVLPVSGGEDYQVVLFGADETVTGGPEQILCEPVFNPGVELSDPDALGGSWPEPEGVAISAPWELTPHMVQEEADDGTYSDFARPLLQERGLEVENPVIKQVVRFDLEGDGIDEVVAVAEDIADSQSLFAQEGDYSLVFMRKVVEGDVQTAVLGESVVADVEEGVTPFILSFVVAAIADMSGDGKMEIVLNEAYYEGIGWTVWEYVNDDLGAIQQIGSGCGV